MVPALTPPPADGPYPARGGNAVTPLVGEFAFFDALLAAIDAAQVSIWMTISFANRAFRLPDGGTLWAAFRRASDRGAQVRLLAWENPDFFTQRNLFSGANRPPLDPRWQVVDHASPDATHCHHEKVWIIDAGAPTEHAFVAGVVLSRLDLVERRAAGRTEGRFDMGVCVRGPVTRDVADAFERRWRAAGGAPVTLDGATPIAGDTWAQVGRTERAGLLRPQGLTTIHQQYQRAIDAARSEILLANQHPGELDLLRRLDAALRRGVRVQLIVPGEPMQAIRVARQTRDPRYVATFEAFAALGRHAHFELCAPVEEGAPPAEYWPYVHAKVACFDKCFITCGSANLVDLSMMADHTETNLHVWSMEVATQVHAAIAAKLTLKRLNPATYALR